MYLTTGTTTAKTCTGSDCPTVCEEDLTCIKMVDSLEYPGHCYDDVMLVARTEDSCKFAPCPSIGTTKFCKCCQFPSYNETCPETCSSCQDAVQGRVLMLLYCWNISIYIILVVCMYLCQLYVLTNQIQAVNATSTWLLFRPITFQHMLTSY